MAGIEQSPNADLSSERVIPPSVQAVLMDKEGLSDIGIELRELANGITIIGTYRGARDTRQASLEVSFPFGALNDPPGKEGVSHYFEHMMPSAVMDEARKCQVGINACTSPGKLTFEASGLVLGQGQRLLAFIPHMAAMLADPLAAHGAQLEAHMSGQRIAILGEIHEDAHSLQRRNAQACNALMYSERNPLNLYPGGTRESIQAITLEDFSLWRDTYLIPDGMMIRVTTNGTKETLLDVMNTLVTNFDTFPRSDVHTNPLPAYWNELHPQFQAGRDFHIHTGYPEAQIYAAIQWILPSTPYDVSEAAAYSLSVIVERKMYDYIRKLSGLPSYTVGSSISTTETHTLFDIGLKIGTEVFSDILGGLTPEQVRTFFAHTLLPHVLQNISEQEIQDYLEAQRVDDPEDMPVLQTRYLDQAIRGIENYGRPVNALAARNVVQSVTSEDIQAVLGQLTTESAITLVIGDINPQFSRRERAVDEIIDYEI